LTPPATHRGWHRRRRRAGGALYAGGALCAGRYHPRGAGAPYWRSLTAWAWAGRVRQRQDRALLRGLEGGHGVHGSAPLHASCGASAAPWRPAPDDWAQRSALPASRERSSERLAPRGPVGAPVRVRVPPRPPARRVAADGPAVGGARPARPHRLLPRRHCAEPAGREGAEPAPGPPRPRGCNCVAMVWIAGAAP